MKPLRSDSKAAASSRFLAGVAVVFLIPLLVLASPPTWWTDRGVLSASPSNDYAAINQGQLKNLAVKAYAEMQSKLPASVWTNAPGTSLSMLINSFQTNSPYNYNAVNLGQLKNVAKPFYDVLNSVGYTNPAVASPYPWSGSSTAPNDYALANIGQTKNLFSFDLGAPAGQLSGWWQIYYFGETGIDGSVDSDGDNASNLEEYNAGTSPINYYNRPGGDLNLPPVVDVGSDHSVTWPQNNVLLEASATDPDGGPQPLSIRWTKVSGAGSVIFSNDATLSSTVSFSESGTYLIQLAASDGSATTSAVVTVNVLAEGSLASPHVEFVGPGNGLALNQGSTTLLWVNAWDNNGFIEKVELYRNGDLVDTLTDAPYLKNWTENSLGAVNFTAVATNDQGLSSSANITLYFYPASVGPPPSGGQPPSAGGPGSGQNQQGKTTQLSLPTDGPLGLPNQSSVITSDQDVVQNEYTYSGTLGGSVLLEVVVSSEEYPNYTEQQSRYNDTVSWSVTPSWGSGFGSSHTVNALHETFNESGEAIVSLYAIRFPNEGNPSLKFKATVQNIGDGVLDTSVHFNLLPVEVKRAWSDQLPDVEANWMPDGTGNANKTYIFMGCRADGKAYAKARIETSAPDQVRDLILWRLAKKSGSSYTILTGTSTLDTATKVVSITANDPDSNDYVLVAGFDSDKNGELSPNEIILTPECLHDPPGGGVNPTKMPFTFKIVNQTKYTASLNAITSQANGFITGLLTPQGGRLLKAFATQTVPAGAGSVATTVDRLESGLTHPVGILFTATAHPGASIEVVFPASGDDLTDEFLASIALGDYLNTFLESKRSVVESWFADPANNSQASNVFFFTTPANASFGFSATHDLDLAVALGRVKVGGVTVQITVDRALNVNEILLSGGATDIYDFDYDSDAWYFSFVGIYPSKAAEVQAGYNTLGIGGRVYKSRILMDASTPHGFEFSYDPL